MQLMGIGSYPAPGEASAFKGARRGISVFNNTFVELLALTRYILYLAPKMYMSEI